MPLTPHFFLRWSHAANIARDSRAGRARGISAAASVLPWALREWARIQSSATHAGHRAQHSPLAWFGFCSGLSHIVGKHQTLGQKVLATPPVEPDAPVGALLTSISGFTQYGQQWPATSSTLKPTGHFKAPQVMLSHGSLMFCAPADAKRPSNTKIVFIEPGAAEARMAVESGTVSGR